ncbi:MAG: glycosyltransferase family 39 protein [Anaerolineae bacterium]|nr:glycosyltransferase family 39 protein [Anaerolineae bacterium]
MSQIPSRVWDIFLPAVLFVVALGLRLPNLLTVPGLKDEYIVINYALDLSEKWRVLLVGETSYIGPFWIYLNALIISIFGRHIEQPRATVMLIGALTVVATFFFAKELVHGDRRVGIIAALLLAFNPQHIMWNSHIAHSNHTTPFFIILAFYFYLVATRRERPALLIAAGLFFGIAAQTHPTALAAAPIFIVDFLLLPRTRKLLRTPYPYVAAGVALLVFSPVLIHNMVTQASAIQEAARRDYAFQPSFSPPELVARAYELDVQMAFLVSGEVKPPPVNQHAQDVSLAIAYFVITAACLVWFTRRDFFPLIAILVGAFGLLVINDIYLNFQGRYVAYMLPVLFAAYAAAGVALWDWAGAQKIRPGGFRVVKWGTRLACLAVLLGLIFTSHWNLQERYALAAEAPVGEQVWLDMVRYAQERPELPLWISSDVAKVKTGKVLLYYLRLAQRPVEVVQVQDAAQIRAVRERISGTPSGILISSETVAVELGGGLKPQTISSCRCSRQSRHAVPAALYVWDNAVSHR